jgi:hypothetical protein
VTELHIQLQHSILHDLTACTRATWHDCSLLQSTQTKASVMHTALLWRMSNVFLQPQCRSCLLLLTTLA